MKHRAIKIITFKKPHSVVNVITNSSSELFVIEGNSKEEIESLIEGLYPNYLDEYSELKSVKDLSNSNLNTFIGYTFHTWGIKDKTQLQIIPGFTFEEMYREVYNDNYRKFELNYGNNWSFVNNENRERVIKGLDPDDNLFMLFSLDENPDYEKQELLETIGYRIHLG